MWKVLAGVGSKIRKNPDYYASLSKINDPGLMDFTTIINLDVHRTMEAQESAEHKRMLTSILLNYSRRNSKVGYCQGLNMLVSYLLVKGLAEEVG